MSRNRRLRKYCLLTVAGFALSFATLCRDRRSRRSILTQIHFFTYGSAKALCFNFITRYAIVKFITLFLLSSESFQKHFSREDTIFV